MEEQYSSNGDSLFWIGRLPDDIAKHLGLYHTLSSLTNVLDVLEYQGRYGRFEIEMGTKVFCDDD